MRATGSRWRQLSLLPTTHSTFARKPVASSFWRHDKSSSIARSQSTPLISASKVGKSCDSRQKGVRPGKDAMCLSWDDSPKQSQRLLRHAHVGTRSFPKTSEAVASEFASYLTKYGSTTVLGIFAASVAALLSLQSGIDGVLTLSYPCGLHSPMFVH